MKTPRQVLLEQHRAAGTDLDRIRSRVLSAHLKSQAQPHPPGARRSDGTWPLRAARSVWLGLFWPARRIWAGFAFVWLVIVAVNLANADHRPPVLAKHPPMSPETLMALQQQQQRILAEFLGATASSVTDRRKPAAPKPRSERLQRWLTG